MLDVLGAEEPLQMSGDNFGSSAAGGVDLDGDGTPDQTVVDTAVGSTK